jgi:hypothetical protein
MKKNCVFLAANKILAPRKKVFQSHEKMSFSK